MSKKVRFPGAFIVPEYRCDLQLSVLKELIVEINVRERAYHGFDDREQPLRLRDAGFSFNDHFGAIALSGDFIMCWFLRGESWRDAFRVSHADRALLTTGSWFFLQIRAWARSALECLFFSEFRLHWAILPDLSCSKLARRAPAARRRIEHDMSGVEYVG